MISFKHFNFYPLTYGANVHTYTSKLISIVLPSHTRTVWFRICSFCAVSLLLLQMFCRLFPFSLHSFFFNYDQFQIICRHTPNRYVSIDKIHMVFLWRLFCFEESVHFSFMFELIPWLKRANEPKISGTFVDIDFLSQPLRENIHFYVILIWNRYKEMRSKIWKIMTQYSHHPDKIKQKLHWISSLDAFHAM